MSKPWETFEVIYLLKNAGFYSVRSLSAHLGRECSDVENVLCSLGVDGVLLVPELLWCDSCATYRTEINAKGMCRVCQLKKNLAGTEDRISKELKQLPLELQAVYSDSEALKGFRASPKPLPIKESKGATDKQKRLAEVAYLVSMEQWQITNAQRLYNASKTRLKRIREHLGTNPRKGKPTNK